MGSQIPRTRPGAYLALLLALISPLCQAQELWGPVLEEFNDMNAVGFVDGNRLYSDRNRPMFVAYVIGVHDALKARLTFCLPVNTTAVQVGDVVAEYLRENPGLRSEQAHRLVRDALVTAWPCHQQQPSPR
jgi:hypothetical protein